MLDLDYSQVSEEDKKMFAEMDHYSALKTELGYDTVWSIESGIKGLDFNIFSDKPRKVTYKIIDRMGDSFDDVDWVTFSSVAKDGTIGALWAAAEDCFQQAKENNGDWHYFIEDFDLQDDGSLSLVTGS
tara:strand:- start:4926 stop:5312 length:387 start_codon:yes stop_codon:yes gene_type:complete